jgi:single-stranded-DNA-specific exonuclease
MSGNDAVTAQVVAELPSVIRDLLRARGITDQAQIDGFLRPNYESDLGDPFTMTDMHPAIERIMLAIRKGETVAVYGDYDIDGVASTVLMLETLQMQGLKPLAYIPDRFEEGYGLNIEALDKLKKQGVTLVITDHHEAPETLPEAVAVVNPKRAEDQYPYKDLSGAGVAFALARALQQHTGIPEKGQEKWLLDLVALGTVCDVMPLSGENRCLVKYGLVVLRKSRRMGLVALAQSAGISLEDVRAYHLGFILGPRLNAAGRLEHATLAQDLLTTKDPLQAQQIAFRLEELNHQRQLEQARVVEEANAQAENLTAEPVLVLADPGWPHGIVGIVAGKVAEKWQKPTLVLQILGDDAKGSGRSANGYNLIEGLQSNRELFSKLGGHAHAAGFSLPVTNLDLVRTSLSSHYASVQSTLVPKSVREADVALEGLVAVNWDLHTILEDLEPFGNGNPQPAFGADGLKVIDVNMVGKNKEHLKLRLADDSGQILEAIGFNLNEKYPNIRPGQSVDAVFFLEKNQFNGRQTLQLVILQLN